MYLITIYSLEFKISIYRAIGAPSHGKDVVDGLYKIDKGLLGVKLLVRALVCFILNQIGQLLFFQIN